MYQKGSYYSTSFCLYVIYYIIGTDSVEKVYENRIISFEQESFYSYYIVSFNIDLILNINHLLHVHFIVSTLIFQKGAVPSGTAPPPQYVLT